MRRIRSITVLMLAFVFGAIIMVGQDCNIVVVNDSFGGYQGILMDQSTGVLMGGSDPRKDDCAMGW